MTRTVGSHGPKTHEAIMAEGIRLIYQHGYEALTMRQLAEAVNLKAGSLYNHVTGKQEVLYVIVREHLSHLLAQVELALADVTDPLQRVIAFVEFHMNYHVTRQKEVYIANSELRSLDRPHKAEILRLRQRYENHFIDILDAAAGAQIISLTNVKVTAYAIISMLTGICVWYTPTHELPREELIRIHTNLVLNGLSAGSNVSRGDTLRAPATGREPASEKAGVRRVPG